MNKIVVVLIIIGLLVVGGFFLFNKPSPIDKVVSTGETKEFNVKAFQFGFDPTTIEVNLGDKVVITAYSVDVPHGLAIPDFGVNMLLMDSTPQTIEFLADKKGIFNFFCSVPCGSGHGSMRGFLVVN